MVIILVIGVGWAIRVSYRGSYPLFDSAKTVIRFVVLIVFCLLPSVMALKYYRENGSSTSASQAGNVCTFCEGGIGLQETSGRNTGKDKEMMLRNMITTCTIEQL